MSTATITVYGVTYTAITHYGLEDQLAILASKGDKQAIVGTVHRVDYPEFMREPTHYQVECMGVYSGEPHSSVTDALANAVKCHAAIIYEYMDKVS